MKVPLTQLRASLSTHPATWPMFTRVLSPGIGPGIAVFPMEPPGVAAPIKCTQNGGLHSNNEVRYGTQPMNYHTITLDNHQSSIKYDRFKGVNRNYATDFCRCGNLVRYKYLDLCI